MDKCMLKFCTVVTQRVYENEVFENKTRLTLLIRSKLCKHFPTVVRPQRGFNAAYSAAISQ